MSLFDSSKNKGKKKGAASQAKQGFQAKGKSNSKSAAKTPRVTGRAQRGS